MKHKEIEIPHGNPFENCKLNRKAHADVLTKVIENYSEGFVLSINNKWGAGKTTFIKMWQQDLDNRGFKTIYFNAWENDFVDNSLSALLGELNGLVTNDGNQKFKDLLSVGAKLTKNIAPALVKGLAGKIIGDEGVKEVIKGVSDTFVDVFEEEVKAYVNKKETIKDFRQKLKEFVASIQTDKTLVFIIDELDRCRPNYAVSILEQMKHFFCVPNIVFVLSIDKEQLKHAICGVYGSDKIDTQEYLKRFIDLEYSIPEPKTSSFIRYLGEYYDIPECNEEGNNSFQELCVLLFRSKPLRFQEKVFSYFSVVQKAFKVSEKDISYLMLLIFIREERSMFYQQMKNASLNLKEVQQELFNMLDSNVVVLGNRDSNYKAVAVVFEAFFLENYRFYKDYKTKEGLKKLFASDHERSLLYNSMWDNALLIGYLRGLIYDRKNDLKFYFDKIDLVENFDVN